VRDPRAIALADAERLAARHAAVVEELAEPRHWGDATYRAWWLAQARETLGHLRAALEKL